MRSVKHRRVPFRELTLVQAHANSIVIFNDITEVALHIPLCTACLTDVTRQALLRPQLDRFEPFDVFGPVEHISNHSHALVYTDRIAR